MVPEHTEDGLLPTGVHRTEFDEFEARFSYFDMSDQRFRLFDKLRELYLQAKRSGIVKRFLVGGSFVTSKPEPNDFDCILVLDPSIEWQELPSAQYNLVSRRRARRTFGGDIFPVIEDSSHHHELLNLFQTTRSGERKGIVEIAL